MVHVQIKQGLCTNRAHKELCCNHFAYQIENHVTLPFQCNMNFSRTSGRC